MSDSVRARVSQGSPARMGLAVAGFSAALVLIVGVLASACVGDITDVRGPEDENPALDETKVNFVRAANPIPGHYIVVMKDDQVFAAQKEMTSLTAALAIN